MTKERVLGLASLACALLMVLAGFTMLAGAQKEQEKVRVIVLFKDKVDEELVKDSGGGILSTYSIIPAVVAELTKDDLKALKKSDKVKAVEEDAEVSICGDAGDEAKGGGKPSPPSPPPETLPWGVDRIDADLVWGSNTGAGIKVAVIDTGIDKDHPDLNVAGGINYVKTGKSVDPTKWDDDNGHGTHCAGIIAALDNEIGVVGVAPGASLYAVKVLNSRGSGWYSDIIKGIDWAANNGMQVASMSLGGTSADSALKAACDAAQGSGVVLVAAAGNTGDNKVIYPAKYTSVIAVSATDSSDNLAGFSCYGSEIALSAPGVSIFSTYKGGTYATLSGTSMACPHVSGTAALVLKMDVGTSDANGNGYWDPAEVQSYMQSQAEDLGTGGWDQYFGFGLVDAGAIAGK